MWVTWDAIVVAGCRVGADGQPGRSLAARTQRAAALYKAGLAPLIVFTGGACTSTHSEARAAANLARRLGVPAEAQILEESSATTRENARYAASLLSDDARIIVVSDSYHVVRCVRVFRAEFIAVVGAGACSPLVPRVRGALREVGALFAYARRGWL